MYKHRVPQQLGRLHDHVLRFRLSARRHLPRLLLSCTLHLAGRCGGAGRRRLALGGWVCARRQAAPSGGVEWVGELLCGLTRLLAGNLSLHTIACPPACGLKHRVSTAKGSPEKLCHPPHRSQQAQLQANTHRKHSAGCCHPSIMMPWGARLPRASPPGDARPRHKARGLLSAEPSSGLDRPCRPYFVIVIYMGTARTYTTYEANTAPHDAAST